MYIYAKSISTEDLNKSLQIYW